MSYFISSLNDLFLSTLLINLLLISYKFDFIFSLTLLHFGFFGAKILLYSFDLVLLTL